MHAQINLRTYTICSEHKFRFRIIIYNLTKYLCELSIQLWVHAVHICLTQVASEVSLIRLRIYCFNGKSTVILEDKVACVRVCVSIAKYVLSVPFYAGLNQLAFMEKKLKL